MTGRSRRAFAALAVVSSILLVLSAGSAAAVSPNGTPTATSGAGIADDAISDDTGVPAATADPGAGNDTSTTDATTTAAPGPVSPTVSPFQPDIKWGGRTMAVDVHPGNRSIALAASESGGLFRTVDGGSTWTHIGERLPHRLSDVKFAPSDPDVIIVSAHADARRLNRNGRIISGGGIWRSTDGGETWSKPASGEPPATFACRGEATTQGIAFEPNTDNVYVGTECGLAVSDDLGETWEHIRVGPDRKEFAVGSVVSPAEGIVDVGTARNGHFRYDTANGTWQENSLPAGVVWNSPSSLAASPADPDVLFAVVQERDRSCGTDRNISRTLYESGDGGETWTMVDYPDRCDFNRPPFVATPPVTTAEGTFDVFVGNGDDTFRQTDCGGTTAPRCRNDSSAWTKVSVDHPDQIDIAYPSDSQCPLFMANDGGVEKTDDCGASWNNVGNSTNAGGLNALQLYRIHGQIWDDHTDLYTGTQDNSIWASPDGGDTWPNSHSNEGGWMSMARYGNNHDNETVTGEAEAGQFKATPHLASTEPWPNPPGIATGSAKGSKPYYIEQGVYLQWSNETDGNRTLWLTDDTGAPGSWSEVVTLRGPDIRGNPIVGPPHNLTMYVPYDRESGGIGLKRITDIRGPGPANVTNVGGDIGSLAIHVRGQGTFDFHTVVAANPNDPDHLIVVDADSEVMKVSHDGGQTWTVDEVLTSAVTSDGEFDMIYGSYRGTNRERRTRNSLVTAIAFDPSEENDRILVGTEANGVIASKDGGETWGRIPGSRTVPAITSFFFDDRTGSDSVRDVYVSTYGRGLWRIGSVDRLISPEPVPVDGCETLDTFFRYELAGNVTDAREQGTCLRIPVYGVTFDGQGYAVRNTADNVHGEAINVTGASDVLFRNLTVAGWEDGIAITRSGGVTITDSVLRANEGTSVRAVNSTGVDAVDLEFDSTGDYDGELLYRGVTGGLIRGNRFVAGDKAVHAIGSEGLRIEANEFTANNNGIWFEHTNDSRIADNRLIDNDGDGINLLGGREDRTGSSGNTIVNNVVRDNEEVGIVIRDSKDNLVSDNAVTDNDLGGIVLGGGIFRDADVADVRIVDNHVAGNRAGITLTGYDAARFGSNPTGVRDVTLSNNTVLDNDLTGITLFSTARVTMRDNSIAGSLQEFIVGEYDPYDDASDRIRTKENYYHDIDTSNTIDGKPIYYLRNASDRTIAPPEDPGFVGIVDGSNVTVRDLSFSNLSHGVLLVDTPDSRVENVTARTVTYGVFLTQGSDRTEVVGNDIEADTVARFRTSASPRGVSVISTNDVLVANNTIASRGGSVSAGIELTSGASRNRVANNTDRNHFRGILIGALGTASADPDVDANTIVDNRLIGNEYGIDEATDDTTGNTIGRNLIESASDVGIDIERGSDYSVVDNVIRDSGQGISAWGDATLRGNRIRGVSGTGISANDGTTVLNNTVLDGGANGIVANGQNIVARNNTVLDTRTGIVVDEAGSIIEHNVVRNISDPRGRGAGILYTGYDTNVVRGNSIEDADVGILVDDGERGDFEDNAVRNTTTGLRVRGSAANNSFAGDEVLNGGEWAFEERPGGFVGTTNTTATNLTIDSTVWRVDSSVEVSFAADDAAFDVIPRTVCDPAGYANAGIFLNATNTAPGGWLNLTIHYPAGAVDAANESTLSLWRYDGTWSEVPGASTDTADRTVTANITEFGYEAFAPLAEGTATCPTLAPNVSVSPTGGVGTVFPGGTATTTVVVENVGFAPLAVDGTTVAGADAGEFTLSNGGSFTLDPGETRDLTVAFSPPATGSYGATLNVTSNDTAAEHVTVALSGNASVLENATATDRTDGDGVLGYRDRVEVAVAVAGGNTDLDRLVANASALGWGNLTLSDGNGDGTYNGTFTVFASGRDADGTYAIPVTGFDAGGNTNRTATNALTLDTTAPTIPSATASDATDGNGTVTDGDIIAVSVGADDAGVGVETVIANASAFGGGNVTLADDDGDGVYEGNATVDEDASPEGSYAIEVVVIDGIGNANRTRTNALTLRKTRPTAAFTVNRSTVNVTEPVGFDASASTDNDPIAGYAWEFGDGTNASGPTAAHGYSDLGSYTVTLTVTDDDGFTDTATRQVAVERDCSDPTPITAPTNITRAGCFALAADLTGVTDPRAIRIEADNVTLLGRNHTIADADSATDNTGISADPPGFDTTYRNLTIRNVTVVGFDVGVSTDDVFDLTVEEVRVTRVEENGLSFSGPVGDPNAVVRGIRGNGSESFFGAGIEVAGYHMTIEDVYLTAFSPGVRFDGEEITARNLTLVDGGAGVSIDGGDVSITDSNVTGSRFSGISITHRRGSDSTRILSTNITDSGDGIRVSLREGPSELVVRGNRITGNEVGIGFVEPTDVSPVRADGVEIHGNLIANNSAYGIENENTTAGVYANATGNDWGLADGLQAPGTNAGAANASPVVDPVTGVRANGTGDNVSEGSPNGTANVRFDPVGELNPDPVANETTCVEGAVAGADGEISLAEIQDAINWWAGGTDVPDTGGETISLAEIQALINAWAEGATVSCGS